MNRGDETLILSYVTDPDTGYRSHSVQSLTNGQLYSFIIRKKISAINDAPEYGPPSYPDQTTPGQPAAIKDLKVTPGACQVTLAWTPPEQNGGQLTRYEYAIAEGYQGHYSQWQVIPSNGITTESLGANYIVTGLHAYAVYRFSVRAVNEHGKAETSTGIAHRVSVDPCGTSLTYNLLADPADSQATLSWTVTPDPEETITKFQYRQKRGTGEWDPWRDITDSNPSGPNLKTYTTVTGLTNCKTYNFQVRAIYDIGSANDSNNASAKPTAESAVTFDSGVVPLTVLENTPAGGDIGSPITATGGSCPPISYSLSGVDAGSFDIVAESGQLQTKAALDHEFKSSYSVTVKADDNNGGTATINATITVADVNEPPKFDSATATRGVPENTEAGENIGAPVTANDPDTGDTLTYTLDGADLDSFDIDSASGQIQTKSGVTYDHEIKSSYSVTVKADDNNGGTATINATITVADVNEPPKFSVETASRTIAENTTTGVDIGAPVTATDPDTGDTLTYTLEGADLDSFDIDSASGQIQTKSGVTYDHEIKSSYSVTVKADDNNGGTATINATITVADVNEPPKFSVETASRTIAENTTTGVAIGAPVTATDPDTGDTPAYTLGGTDANFFDIDTSTGQLWTQAALDYETKSSYTVAVTASDGTLTATVDVPVTVTNIDEAGTVTLSTNQPPARAEITAALTDPDKGVTGTVWQWERSSDWNTDWADIGTGSPSYTPVDGDVGYHLRATASYADGHGPGKTAQAVSTQAVQAGANRPPEFDSATATREVPENTEAGGNIGAPVTATDPDTGDTLTYTLGGTHVNYFDIDTSTGQLQTQAALDHETRNSYTVTVTATDPSNATGEVTVTITVTDEDEGGSVTLSSPQPRVSSELSATLNDPDAGVTHVTWQWASTSTAQGTYVNISVATSASYTPVAGDVGKFLRATASYTDKFASNKNAQAVSAAVQAAPPPPPALPPAPRQPAPPPPPSNTAPEFPGTPATRTVAENTAAGVNIGNPIAATDPDSDTLTYSLRGVDAGSFDIVAESGRLQTKAALDYETRNSYTVTVTATDPSNATGEVTVTITVTDEDEGGSVSLSPQPRVSSELSATLNDPDAGVTRVTWQWAVGRGPWAVGRGPAPAPPRGPMSTSAWPRRPPTLPLRGTWVSSCGPRRPIPTSSLPTKTPKRSQPQCRPHPHRLPHPHRRRPTPHRSSLALQPLAPWRRTRRRV